MAMLSNIRIMKFFCSRSVIGLAGVDICMKCMDGLTAGERAACSKRFSVQDRSRVDYNTLFGRNSLGGT